MHGRLRISVEELEQKVPVPDRVVGVARRRGETQLTRQRLEINRHRGACKRGGAERHRRKRPRAGRANALKVAEECPAVGREHVPVAHGLAVLLMREAGNKDIHVTPRAFAEREDELPQTRCRFGGHRSRMKPERRRDQVVARAAEVHALAEIPRPLRHEALEVHVDVLVLRPPGEAARAHESRPLFQRGLDARDVGSRQPIRATQGAGPGLLHPDLALEEPGVDLDSLGELEERSGPPAVPLAVEHPSAHSSVLPARASRFPARSWLKQTVRQYPSACLCSPCSSLSKETSVSS